MSETAETPTGAVGVERIVPEGGAEADAEALTNMQRMLKEAGDNLRRVQDERDDLEVRLESAIETTLDLSARVVAAEQRGAEKERERIKPLVQRMGAALITVEHNLDTPYPDAPEWTPWTRWIAQPIKALRSAVGLP